MLEKQIFEIITNFKATWQLFTQIWWIVLPAAFYILFKALWMDYVIIFRLRRLDNVLLEITPPKNIEKGPKMMESFYSGIAGVVVTILPFDKYLKGDLTNMFSLELTGDEGQVHFYVRCETKHRHLVEAQIYAQYPDAEIREVEDYVRRFPRIIPNKDWNLWGSDVVLNKPDPYPIRTYDKFEETITGTMNDPLSAMTEVLGKLGPGQHIWLQYVIQPLQEKWREDQMQLIEELAKRTDKKSGGFWADLMEVFGKVISGMSKPAEFAKKEKKEQQPVEFQLTPGEKDVLKAVEENLGKNSFSTKMRLLVFGRRENYDKSFIPTFFGTLKQFTDLNLNSFKPDSLSKTSVQYLMTKSRMAYRQRKIWRRYKDRDMSGKKFVLSTKELATVFHFPDMGVMAPKVPRIEAKKGSAPANLPVG